MAKGFPFALLIASALFFSSPLRIAFATAPINVQGKVYCDTCRVEFETDISLPLSGTTVKLECRSRANNTISYTVEGQTNKNGMYKLPVDDKDHAEEICEVVLVKSGMADCAEPFKSTDRARVLLAKDNGVVQQSRFANPLGFMKAKAVDDCGRVLNKMGFLPINL